MKEGFEKISKPPKKRKREKETIFVQESPSVPTRGVKEERDGQAENQWYRSPYERGEEWGNPATGHMQKQF